VYAHKPFRITPGVFFSVRPKWSSGGISGVSVLAADTPKLSSLDLQTLAFVAVCLGVMLGVMLIFAWVQQRNVRALAWWGSAYLLGASSIAIWCAPAPLFDIPSEWAQTLTFLACGMIWNGVRLFHGRRLLPTAAFSGAIIWLGLCQLPDFAAASNHRVTLSVAIVAMYTFCIAFELNRERRKSLYSRTAAILVPFLHGAIFASPLAMQAFLPSVYAASWLTVFTVETMLYAVGAAFIVLLMVKDNDVDLYRSAASTDPLTGLLNRRAFLEGALSLCARQANRGQAVTLLMLDLDHFKSINDRFGHATGDEVLRVFAGVARSNMRGGDLVGRLGGEEFAVIVPEPIEFAERIAERLRAAFAAAGVTIDGHVIGATCSIGAASSAEAVADISALIARADAALYRAKRDGRNRVHVAGQDGQATHDTPPAVVLSETRRSQATKAPRLASGKPQARRVKSVAQAAAQAAAGRSATSRLPSAR
jgi:diguanylate cyclase (GGDEF)-like protein